MKRKTALIFDDNLECRSLMKDVAEMAGYEVMTFSDPTIFLNQREESCCHRETDPCVDLVMTDNQMPGMTGLEFLEMLKRNGCKLPDYNKCIISGAWSQDQLDVAKALGCKVFSKPASIEELQGWLNSFPE